jgi:hypothetical protein
VEGGIPLAAKEVVCDQALVAMPVILATQEEEIRRITV